MTPRRTFRVVGAIMLVAAAATLTPDPAGAQPADHGQVSAAGSQYRAGLLHRWILGRHYRDIWTAVIEVDVLDLSSYAGGLEARRTGGGQQTRSLRFDGADGREYSFRSVDKDPSAVLDSIFHGTVVDDLVQDGISAAHPYGALVAAPLLEAAGVLHVEPQLLIMPDDPALGAFREEFAGMLGLIEEQPDENAGARTAFAETNRVIASEALTRRLDEGPDDQMDRRAFLTARLMDLLLGDWDRHRGQWRWATYSDEAPRRWLPVPRDRDQAFSKFDGLATRIVSLYMPQFVRFEEDYPSITRLHWNGRDLDRWFLAGLERPAWDSVTTSLQTRITDAVIDDAVARLPTEIQDLGGADLARALKVRRDHLGDASDSFYRLLADKVDIRATDADDVVTITETAAGGLRVTLRAPEVRAEPYFDRDFLPSETDEVRVHLQAGDDRVNFAGTERSAISVRVVGGSGDDRFDVGPDGRHVRLYDNRGNNEALGADAPTIDDGDFVDWVWSEDDRDQPRDWGRLTQPIFWSSFSSDLGVFVGGGIHLEYFGFRRRPYLSTVDIRGGFAPTTSRGRAAVDGRVFRESSSTFFDFGARISRLDVIRYYGLGNASPSGGSDFHKVDQTTLSARAGIGVESPGLTISAGVGLERISTQDNPGRFYGSLGGPYGDGAFVQMRTTARAHWTPLGESIVTGNRLRLEATGSFFPDLFNVTRDYASARADMSLLLAPSPSPWVSLAVRAGGEQVWGRFPWHQAAFLGGGSTLQGWDEQRFAGDAAVFGAAELRLRLWQPRVIVPASLGAFGVVDAGRVSLAGASPGGWHTSVGGGLWFQPVVPAYIIRMGFAQSTEATKLFVTLGLPY